MSRGPLRRCPGFLGWPDLGRRSGPMPRRLTTAATSSASSPSAPRLPPPAPIEVVRVEPPPRPPPPDRRAASRSRGARRSIAPARGHAAGGAAPVGPAGPADGTRRGARPAVRPRDVRHDPALPRRRRLVELGDLQRSRARGQRQALLDRRPAHGGGDRVRGAAPREAAQTRLHGQSHRPHVVRAPAGRVPDEAAIPGCRATAGHRGRDAAALPGADHRPRRGDDGDALRGPARTSTGPPWTR